MRRFALDASSDTGTALIASVIAALQDAAFALTGTGYVLCANAGARQIFSGLQDGVPVSLAVRAPEILDAIRGAQGGDVASTIWLSRVPLERQFEVRAADLGGAWRGVLLITLRDTTHTRRIERMRADFVANASHELRTPLASLLGFVETLQGPARDDPNARHRFLGIMGEQARRMSRLIDDLLSLSRIEQSLHVRPDGPVDLTSVASHICDALAPMATDGGTEIRLQIANPVHVRGDRDELLRVAENLVENAIKYGGPGVVTVSVREDGEHGAMLIEDRGPGIAPEHIPRLTERFYRVDSEASRAKGGTGLGLAIVKHIIARHHGRFTVQSQPMQGARFTVAIPLAPREV